MYAANEQATEFDAILGWQFEKFLRFFDLRLLNEKKREIAQKKAKRK